MESFFQIVTIVFVSNSQHSLRDRKGSKIVLSKFQKFTHTHLKKLNKPEKRALSDLSSKLACNASMTVEAACVLPIFLFCFMNVMFSFRMLETQSRVLAALHQTGNQICFCGYGSKFIPDALPDGVVSLAMSEGYVRGSVTNKLGTSFLQSSAIKGKAAGLSFIGSNIMGENDIVDIQARWWAKPFIGGYGFLGFATGARYYGRAWTGYETDTSDGAGEQTDRMVYITEHGTVYHNARDCYHLTPNISQISAGSVDQKRNQSGQKYRACMYCGEKNVLQTVCYITPEGDCYHNNPNCSGLKRTIYTVPLSTVSDRPPCAACQ